jgi:hypothetical protein
MANTKQKNIVQQLHSNPLLILNYLEEYKKIVDPLQEKFCANLNFWLKHVSTSNLLLTDAGMMQNRHEEN